jgi:photosystem II stability/assembly factor-like uncharacterized protein
MKGTLFFFGLVFSYIAAAQNSEPTFIGLQEGAGGSLWLSGTNSTFLSKASPSTPWQKHRFLAVDSLQFRDVHAFNADSCLLLGAGTGALSRIYRYSITKGFELRYTMPNRQGFLNGMALNNKGLGYAYGDAVDNYPFILETRNYGQTWQRVDTLLLPKAGLGEGGFAASGTGVNLSPQGHFFIGTGAANNARILYKNQQEAVWKSIKTPMPLGDFAGITSVQVVDSIWFITGGDLADSSQQNNLFVSYTEGESWQALAANHTAGALYGSALRPYKKGYALVVCGPQGADVSFNLGKSWRNISTVNIWTCLITLENELWLAGKNGFMESLPLRDLHKKR